MRFAVHRPGIPAASPRSHGVPRRDVPGRIHVSVGDVSAGGAPEDGLALARLRVHLPARRAPLARESGTDPLHPAGCLVLQATHQYAPPRRQDAPVQGRLLTDVPTRIIPRPPRGLGHAADPEVFDPDQVKPPGDIRAGFLGPVLASVRLASAQPPDGDFYPIATFRATSSPGQLALQSLQPSGFPSGQNRRAQQLTRRQSRRYGHASINTYDFAAIRCRNCSGDHGEGDMPSACSIQRHPEGFNPRRHGTGPAEPHPSCLGYPDFTGFSVEPPHMLRLHCDDAEPLVPPGLPPRRPPGRVAWIEESAHCLSEVPKRLLLHHLGPCGQPRMLGAGSGELSALLRVSGRACPSRAPVLVLLNSQIPYVPSVAAVVSQHALLGERGKQSVPTHTNTLSTATDIFGEVKRRAPSNLRAQVSTSRAR